MANDFKGLEGQTVPDMPDSFINEVTDRYVGLYEQVTGQRFERTPQNIWSATSKWPWPIGWQQTPMGKKRGTGTKMPSQLCGRCGTTVSFRIPPIPFGTCSRRNIHDGGPAHF